MKAKKKPKILLPRALSWSGLDLWERDQEEFKNRYFKGKPSFENDAMRFGKHISNMLEGKEKPNDHIEQSVILLREKLDHPEYNIRVPYKTPYGPIELNGYLDDVDTKTFLTFIENKTGTGKWTNKKADKHGQISFYYLLIILHTGIRPRRAILQHFETEIKPGALFNRKLTGYIYPYDVELSVGHEIEIRRRIDNAVLGISQAYTTYLLENNL